jgi:Glycosyl transferases group 1
MAVIVHASNFTVGPKGGYHNTSIRLSNGLVRNGHLVLNFSDRDVARASSIMGSRKFGRGAVNRMLRDYCRLNRPDLLLLGHADTIAPGTVAEIRDAIPGLRVLQWNIDPLFDDGNVRRIASKRGVVDATLVTTGIAALGPLRQGGHRVGFLPNPVDPSIERGENHRRADLPFDLFYACAFGHETRHVCGRDWTMDGLMSALLGEVPNVKARLCGLLGKPRLDGANYQDALESAGIGLNVSRRPDWPLYSSDRLAHLIGNGMAVLMERVTGYDAFFGDDEMLFFSSFEELVRQVRDTVADPARRQAVATAGHAKYHRYFNERTVARYVLDFAFERADARSYGWPEGLI